MEYFHWGELAVREMRRLDAIIHPNGPTVTMPRKLAEDILDTLEDDWHRIDGEWGPTKGGIEADIAAGECPEIAALRAILGR